jgi:hypothetical protein
MDLQWESMFGVVGEIWHLETDQEQGLDQKIQSKCPVRSVYQFDRWFL